MQSERPWVNPGHFSKVKLMAAVKQRKHLESHLLQSMQELKLFPTMTYSVLNNCVTYWSTFHLDFQCKNTARGQLIISEVGVGG
jgi:hypothetical protein